MLIEIETNSIAYSILKENEIDRNRLSTISEGFQILFNRKGQLLDEGNWKNITYYYILIIYWTGNCTGLKYPLILKWFLMPRAMTPQEQLCLSHIYVSTIY